MEKQFNQFLEILRGYRNKYDEEVKQEAEKRTFFNNIISAGVDLLKSAQNEKALMKANPGDWIEVAKDGKPDYYKNDNTFAVIVSSIDITKPEQPPVFKQKVARLKDTGRWIDLEREDIVLFYRELLPMPYIPEHYSRRRPTATEMENVGKKYNKTPNSENAE